MAIPTATNDTGHLKTQAYEFVKQYIEYDGSNRTEYVYTVRADATDGTPCSVVRYSYDGASTRIVYMQEYTSNWQAAWETF